MTKEPSTITFLSATGEPLPDWIQTPLQRQVGRLARDFPTLHGDCAVIQNILDQVGQRVVEKVAGGLRIENVNAYVDTAAHNAAIDATKHPDVFGRARTNIVPVTEQTLEEHSVVQPDSVVWKEAREWLNAQEEELLMRYFFYGEYHTEIAAGLGLSETAVRSRFSRAIEKVRRRFCCSKSPGRS